MKHYLDITLLPDAEANLGFLWQKVYQQVHIALVEYGYESNRTLKMQDGAIKKLKNSKIALSFPEYCDHKFPLGSKLRLFAKNKRDLELLAIHTWLSRLTDYVDIGDIKSVPEHANNIIFKQKRVKGIKRLDDCFRRKEQYLKNKFGADFDPEYKNLVLNKSFNRNKLPFIQLESQTSKKYGGNGLFQLFIEKLDAETANYKDNEYDCYGLALSKTATVPWF